MGKDNFIFCFLECNLNLNQLFYLILFRKLNFFIKTLSSAIASKNVCMASTSYQMSGNFNVSRRIKILFALSEMKHDSMFLIKFLKENCLSCSSITDEINFEEASPFPFHGDIELQRMEVYTEIHL